MNINKPTHPRETFDIKDKDKTEKKKKNGGNRDHIGRWKHQEKKMYPSLERQNILYQ